MQPPLPLNCEPNRTLENFESGTANRELFQAVCSLSAGHASHNIYLYGPSGEGRSHLLLGACRAFGAGGGQAIYLPLRELHGTEGRTMLSGLEQAGLLCLDDVDAIAGDQGWEEALFHLYNRVQGGRQRLLLSAECSPMALGLQLGDLVSRLTTAQVYALQTLPEDDRGTLFRRRAAALGLELDARSLQYILLRAPRSTGALMRLLEHLDHCSLAQRRRLTVPFVRESMQWQ